MTNCNPLKVLFLATAAVLVLSLGCGSVTPDGSAIQGGGDPNPTTPMSVASCAAYCGCHALVTSLQVTGDGICNCVVPQPDAGVVSTSWACRCAGWSQAPDAGTGPGGLPWTALLWSPAPECDTYSGA